MQMDDKATLELTSLDRLLFEPSADTLRLYSVALFEEDDGLE